MENDDSVSSLSLISSVETLTNKDEVDEEDEGTGDGGGESSLNEVKVLDIFEVFCFIYDVNFHHKTKC